jgi:hypothetical protein
MGGAIAILIVATSIGAVCAIFIKGRAAYACAAMAPWLAMLGLLFYSDQLGIPATFDARTMWWPEKQLYLGTLVAIFGLVGCWVTKLINREGGRAT